MKALCLSWLGLHVAGLLRLQPALAAECYYPHGAVTNNLPCNTDAEVSVCCGANQFGIACLDNKFCQGADGRVFRGTCTDQSWESPDCPKFCEGTDVDGLIHTCSTANGETTYCCNNDDEDCCNMDSSAPRFTLTGAVAQTSAVWNAAASRYDLVARFSTTTESSSTASESSATTTTSITTTTPAGTSPTATNDTHNTQDQSSSSNNQPAPTTGANGTNNDQADTNQGDELSTAAKAGIGVGAAAGALLLAALAYMAWRMRRMRRMMVEASSSQWQQPPPAAAAATHVSDASVSELYGHVRHPGWYRPAVGKSSELPVQEKVVEMQG